jgi:hypothetical protein
LFSLKKIVQNFEKSFVLWNCFWANLGETYFLQFFLKTKSSFQQLKYTHTHLCIAVVNKHVINFAQNVGPNGNYIPSTHTSP